MRFPAYLMFIVLCVGCHGTTDYNAPGNPNAVPAADNNMLVQVDQARAAYTATLQIVAPLLEANSGQLAKAIPQSEKDAVRQAITEAHNGLDESESYARQNKSIDFGFVFDRVKSAINVITAFKLRHAPQSGATQPTSSTGDDLWESKKSSPWALRPYRQARNFSIWFGASRPARR